MTSSVLVAIRVAADPATAFAVFTEEIAAWWRPGGLFAITPRGDGALAFEGGLGGRLISRLANGKEFEIGRITEWSPPDVLAFTWRQASFSPDQITDVRVSFEAIAEETRVTVEHRGWAEIPREHVARHGFPDPATLTHVANWWRASLAALQARAAHR